MDAGIAGICALSAKGRTKLVKDKWYSNQGNGNEAEDAERPFSGQCHEGLDDEEWDDASYGNTQTSSRCESGESAGWWVGVEEVGDK